MTLVIRLCSYSETWSVCVCVGLFLYGCVGMGMCTPLPGSGGFGAVFVLVKYSCK